MTYGFMTRSFLHSPENRAMQKARREYTAKYLAGVIRYDIPPLPVACPCDYRKWAHLGHHDLKQWDKTVFPYE